MISHKIHVKIGQNDFMAEGSQEAVQSQYELFLEAITKVTPQDAAKNPPEILPDASSGNGNNPTLLPAELDRAFKLDRNGIVSLRTLPSTDQRNLDTLILLIYGFQKVKDQHDVSAVQLMTGSRQSGLSMARFDRLFAGQEAMIRRGGKKKGTRYSLTNPGVNHAEELLKSMFG